MGFLWTILLLRDGFKGGWERESEYSTWENIVGVRSLWSLI